MESFIFCAVIFSFSSMFYRAYFTVSLYKYIITGVVNITMIHLLLVGKNKKQKIPGVED